ncbi:ABC transporter ATP-binding protein [Clostridium formicaceticum]|uniref:ABC transporter ATP-binding protein n=1 Tax=Clostridium formicaceticum TaxID=1497 RepID=A0AAC9RMV3_9CLOT|nr:ABC transporter ATP-binding protein [Clostridium formicaceticum]AOY77586.1 ABC transporter ATP-binding protein [Clostridium formicaceticum]ARE88165.1 Lipoprotein-releasing system ATP-binding protein LolD [Clostridium formicaceticum]
MACLISARNINKIYEDVIAVKNVNLEIKEGFYAIMGRSGSGKTTLLNILGLLDDLTDGELYVRDRLVSKLNDIEKAKIRMKDFGFVFQSFHLNPKLKAFENVMVPMYINEEYRNKDLQKRAIELLELLEMKDRCHHFPSQLSGGQQQRVAIARALANDPACIFADEPTGNLDTDSEKIVLDHLKLLSQKGKTVVIVSHNDIVLDYADKVYYMNNGILEEKNEA